MANFSKTDRVLFLFLDYHTYVVEFEHANFQIVTLGYGRGNTIGKELWDVRRTNRPCKEWTCTATYFQFSCSLDEANDLLIKNEVNPHDLVEQPRAIQRHNMKVSIWYNTNTGTSWFSSNNGDASLQLSNGSYYSYETGFYGRTLDDDIRAKGGSPDKTVNLGELEFDEERIEKWLDGQMRNRTIPYFGIYSCWVVYAALREGGGGWSPNPYWSPGILFRYLNRLQKGFIPMLKRFSDTPLF